MIFLEDFTLIIPTKNRPEFLNRILRFYSSQEIQFNILVIDSSDKLKQKVKNISRKYLPESNYINIGHASTDKAILEGTQRINTKFSACIADDDVILPSGILTALIYLRKQKQNNFVVIGDSLQFGIFSKLFEPVHGKIRSLNYIQSRDFLQETPEDRLLKFFNSSKRESLVFGITTNALMKSTFKQVSKLPYSQRHVMSETFHSILVLKKSKVKRFQKVFLIRQSHQGNAYHANSIIEWLSLPEHFEALEKIQKELKNLNRDVLKFIHADLNQYINFKLENQRINLYKIIKYLVKPIYPYFLVRTIKLDKKNLQPDALSYLEYISMNELI